MIVNAARRACATSALEYETQCELDLPCGESRPDGAEGRRTRAIGVRVAEVGVVEGVEQLATELNASSLGDGEVLADSEIDLVEAVAPDDVAAGVAERLRLVGGNRRVREAEVVVDGAARRADRPGDVRTIRQASTEIIETDRNLLRGRRSVAEIQRLAAP